MAALDVDYGSGIFMAGYAGYDAFHAVFLRRTTLLGIMDGMDQNDSIPFARRRFRLWHMQCWFCWYCTSRCVPSCFRQASDARHHGRYEPEGQVYVEMVINILVVTQRQFLLVLTVQETIMIPQLQFLDTVIDDPVCVSCRFSQVVHPLCATTYACGSDSRKLRIPAVQYRRLFPDVVQRPIPMVWASRTIEISQLLVKVTIAPVMLVVRSSSSLSRR